MKKLLFLLITVLMLTSCVNQEVEDYPNRTLQNEKIIEHKQNMSFDAYAYEDLTTSSYSKISYPAFILSENSEGRCMISYYNSLFNTYSLPIPCARGGEDGDIYPDED